MKLKVDRGLLPVKAHFFFFFAALGPLLPQMNVFGRQLGVSPSTMGLVTAVLPLLWAVAKPLFGYLVDYFTNQRKLIFMMLIIAMTGSYCGLWFLPMPTEVQVPIEEYVYHLNDTVYIERLQSNSVSEDLLDKYKCHWHCQNVSSDDKFDIYLSNSTYINTMFVDGNATCSLLHMDFDEMRAGQNVCRPKENCNLLCLQEDLINETDINSILNGTRPKRNVESGKDKATSEDGKLLSKSNGISELSNVTSTVEEESDSDSFYTAATFWWFVILMCVGTVAFNVANCIGDAVCFDVLGAERSSAYGAQRAWGTAGYGLTALLGGWLVDRVSVGPKDFTPAFVLALAFTAADLVSCRKLTLPSLSPPDDSGAALLAVLRMPRVLVFLVFAIIAGTFDSFIIYYMFWFLEELAEATGHTGRIKLIEGAVVAAESFIGELLFFYFSGRIIKRWGYGLTMTFSLFCYGVRLALISLITNPWQLVFVEGIMQGPTYALCYSSIVGYASHVAPEGYSATVQGVVAGMDDGVGFALGSLLGGQMYGAWGGRTAFRVMAATAAVASACHLAVCLCVTKGGTEPKQPPTLEVEEGEKMLPIQANGNGVYMDTVVPLTGNSKDAATGNGTDALAASTR